MKPYPPITVLPWAGEAFLESLNRNQRGTSRAALGAFQKFAELYGRTKPGTPLPLSGLGRAIVGEFYDWLLGQPDDTDVPAALGAVDRYLDWLRKHHAFRRRIWPPGILPEEGERFLDESGGGRHSKTYSSYRAALLSLQRFAQKTGLAHPYTPLSPQDIDETVLASYYSELVSDKKSDATIRLYLAVASLFFEWLDAEKRLPSKVKILTLRAKLDAKTKRRLKPARRGSDRVLGRLLDYFDRQVVEGLETEGEDADEWSRRQRRLIALRNRALIHTLYSTAGRAAEVAGLPCAIARVDSGRRARPATPEDRRSPEQRQLWAEKGLVVSVVNAHKITGKGGVERTIVFTHDAQLAIEGYVAARVLSEGTLEPDRALFVSHARNMYQALTPQSIWRQLNEGARVEYAAGGRPAHIGPHAFRHLRAQQLSNEGMSIDVLQKYLGHANVNTTRSTYAPDTPDEVILDQVATFGKSASAVIEEARE